MKNTILYILYDGIHNAVFASQVLAPLQRRKTTNPEQEIIIISFERHPISTLPTKDIPIQVLKRHPYITTWSLWPAIRQARHLLQKYHQYEIIARGPFAGYIALHAATQHCNNITIQARGLVAQEYAYTHSNKNVLHRMRMHSFSYLEQQVYGTQHPKATIEAVSPALAAYLSHEFGTLQGKIALANDDIPVRMSSQERSYYHSYMRSQLGIPHNTTVYCYNGSYKPWQCPEQTIRFFKTRMIHENCLLLILTPDPQAFQKAVHIAQLPPEQYRICSVTQDQLYRYLAAADYGLLLREPHIMNYISRPTKALDYHAAHVHVLHNNTVAYIQQVEGLKHSIIQREGSL